MPTIHRLGPDATAAQLDATTRTLEYAFDDHVTRALMGSVEGLPFARFRSSVVTSALDLECWVASLEGVVEGGPAPVDGIGRVDGMMLVKQPGVEHGKSPNAKGPHSEPPARLAATEPGLTQAAAEIMQTFDYLEELAFGPTRVTNTYYVSHLAIGPWAQRRGLGSFMLRHVMARAAKEGFPVTLLTFTQDKVDIYEKIGFHVRGECESVLNGTPVHWWAMSTEPGPTN